jgi:hypothetical protein
MTRKRAMIVAALVLVIGGLTVNSARSAYHFRQTGWGHIAWKVYRASDVCPNIKGVQQRVPVGYVKNLQGNCVPEEVSPSPTPTPTPTPTEPPVGDMPVPQAGFTRIFTDEFSGAALDTTKWSAYSSKLSSSDGCPRPENNIVANGVLSMVFAYDTNGYCGANWYHGSMMIKSAYAGNNQSVTLRFRVIASDPANTRSHRILPMRWPTGDPWYIGESDYCEGSSYSYCTAFLHHSTSSSQVASPDIVFAQTQWHTIRATQLAGNDVQIFVDDMLVPVWNFDGSPTTVPDVTKRTVLQQECRSSCPTDTNQTERIEIDFVTVDNQQ